MKGDASTQPPNICKSHQEVKATCIYVYIYVQLANVTRRARVCFTIAISFVAMITYFNIAQPYWLAS